MNKNIITLIIALVIVAVVAVLAFTGVITNPGAGDTDTMEQDDSEVVATVNGEDITRGELTTRFTQAEQNIIAQGQGAQLEDEEVRSQLEAQVLDQLVAERLVAQQIAANNVTVTEAEVDAEVDGLITQLGGAAAFTTQLEQAGVTEDQVRADIATQLITQKYLLSVIDTDSVSVTDEEVQAAYDQIAANQADVPPLDDTVREQLRAQLVQQEQQALVNQHIASLRAEADVEVLI